MRNSLLRFLLAFFCMTLVSCQSSKKAGTNTLYLPMSDDVKTFDPTGAYDSISLDVVPLIYETLYQYKYLSQSYELEPLLAEGMPEVSKDKLELTIKIKKNIHYVDDPCFEGGKGREVGAEDFIYAFKRHALPSIESQGWWVFENRFKGMDDYRKKLIKLGKGGASQSIGDPVEGLVAIDAHTLKLKLTRPYPQLMYVLAMPFTAPIPIEAVKKYGDPSGALLDHPVGTGPYKLASWERGHKITLVKNPQYRPEFYPTQGAESFKAQGLLADAGQKIPFIDTIEYNLIKETGPSWLLFLKGKIDVLSLPKDNFATAIVDKVNLTDDLKKSGIKLQIASGVRFYYVAINMKDKFLGHQKLVRQAISSAIDRQKWIDLFTNGRGQKMVNALPPGLLDRPKTDKIKYDYDPTRARELLAQAGFPGGKGLPKFTFDMRGSDSVNRQLGEFFEKSMSEVGIGVSIVYNTFPAYLEKLKTGRLQISIGGWGLDYPDAENSYQLLYGGNSDAGTNESGYKDPLMNALYEQMSIMEPGAQRAELIQKMDDLLQEQCPWALGYYHTNFSLYQGWLKNYRSDDIITNRQKYWKLDQKLLNRMR